MQTLECFYHGGILGSMFLGAQESFLEKNRPWKTSPVILVRLRGIIRASFSQERMTYIPDQSMVVYQSKDGKHEKTFDALEWPRW